VEDEFPTVLLSRSLLEELGICPDKQLAEKAKQIALACAGRRYEDDDEMEEELDIEEREVPIGALDPEALKDAVDASLQQALKDGFPAERFDELRKVVYSGMDCMRISLGPDPPASVTPLEIRMKRDAVPVRCRPRRHPPKHQAFLSEHVKTLLVYKLVYTNPSSEWVSAAFAVLKPNNRGMRMVVDMRDCNHAMIKHVWPMPVLETMGTHLEGSSVFAIFDLFKGYWQFPVSGQTDAQTFMTPEGVFTPTRLLMGNTNSVAGFQAGMQEVLGELLYTECLLWIDDVLSYWKDIDGLLEGLTKLFARLRQFGVKLNAKRCSWYVSEAKWCGKLYSDKGVRHDPSRIEGLMSIPAPELGDELLSFLAAANWMRDSIPGFAEIVSPLRRFLEKMCKAAKARDKRSLHRFHTGDFGWGKEEDAAFQQVKEALKHCVQLQYPDEDKEVCVFTDASGDFWSIVVTQVPPEDLDKPFSEQRHSPLAFLSGEFKGAQRNWAIVEKEAFPMVKAVERLDYLLFREKPAHFFVDHRNLTFIFDPSTAGIPLRKHTLDKLQRWSLRLSELDYLIEHIAGDDNVWADLMTRWGAPKVETPTVRALRFGPGLVQPLDHPEFHWPSMDDIRGVQQAAAQQVNPPEGSVRDVDGVWITHEERIWIPVTADSEALRVRLCIVAHAGVRGHRGQEATLAMLQKKVWWTNMRKEVISFCNQCLHCVVDKHGTKVPRPFGHTVRGTRPGQVLQVDFVHMGKRNKADAGFEWTLVMVDPVSGVCMLLPCKTPSHVEAAEGLMLWISCYGKPETLVSDQGSHFKNKWLAELTQRLRMHHHLTVAWVPWSHGSVERLNRTILQATRAMLSEMRLSFSCWPSLMPAVQHCLNHTPLQRLAGHAPVTVMTGHAPDDPLEALYIAGKDEVKQLSKGELESWADYVDRIRKDLDLVHKEVAEQQLMEQQRRDRAHKRKHPSMQRANFGEGDFVLTAKVLVDGQKLPNKLSVRWTGPHRIVDVLSEHIFEVQHLITGARRQVHASRLRYYCDSKLEVTEELYEQVAFDDEAFVIEKLIEFRPSSSSYEFLVQWQGFEASDRTWTSFETLKEDVPALLTQWLKKQRRSPEVQAMLLQLS
jgi:transposase InsO family protein